VRFSEQAATVFLNIYNQLVSVIEIVEEAIVALSRHYSGVCIKKKKGKEKDSTDRD
jgi:hypothetical protein